MLLVSTDPASNLDEVLGVRLSGAPTAIPGAGGLFALNIDPEAAAKAYRDRVIGPYRGSAPRSLDQQHGRTTIRRLHGRDRRFRRIHETAWRCRCDRGIRSHHLRHGSDWAHASLVETSGCMDGIHCREHDRHLVPWATGRSRNSEVPIRLQSARSHRRSNDHTGSGKPSRALGARRSESYRGAELADMGIANQRLFLNGVFVAQDRGDAAARALEIRGQEALAGMPADLAKLPRIEVPLLPYAPMGVENLRCVFGGISPTRKAPYTRTMPSAIQFRTSPFCPDRRTRKDGARCRDDDGERRRRQDDSRIRHRYRTGASRASGTSQHDRPSGSPGGNGRRVRSEPVGEPDRSRHRDSPIHRSRPGESGVPTGRAGDGLA